MIEKQARFLYGDVVAEGVSAEDYMHHHAQHRREWIEGTVIQLSPASRKHNELIGYFRELFRAYFSLRPIGTSLLPPFVMQLAPSGSRREPDLMVILNDNADRITDTMVVGPADICIEIISPESAGRDYSNKFEEYERGGVREYWIIDPQRQDARFHQLGEDGVYTVVDSADDTYRPPLLPDLQIHIPTLWKEPLPGFYEIGDSVREMLSPKMRRNRVANR